MNKIMMKDKDWAMRRRSLRRWVIMYEMELVSHFGLKPTYSWTKQRIKEWRENNKQNP